MSGWGTFDTYLTLGITGYSTVKMFLNLRAYDSQSLQMAVTPLIATIRMTFPTVNVPDELVGKVCDAVAETVKDYWAGKVELPQGTLSGAVPTSLSSPSFQGPASTNLATAVPVKGSVVFSTPAEQAAMTKVMLERKA